MWVLVQEAFAVVQVRDDGDFHQGGSSGDGERDADLEMLEQNGQDLVMDGLEVWGEVR